MDSDFTVEDHPEEQFPNFDYDNSDPSSASSLYYRQQTCANNYKFENEAEPDNTVLSNHSIKPKLDEAKERTVICYCSAKVPLKVNDLVEAFVEPGDLHLYAPYLDGFGTINCKTKIYYLVFKPFVSSSNERLCLSLHRQFASGALVRNCQGLSFFLLTKMMEQQSENATITLFPIPPETSNSFIRDIVHSRDWGICGKIVDHGGHKPHLTTNRLLEVDIRNVSKDCIPPFIIVNSRKVFVSVHQSNLKFDNIKNKILRERMSTKKSLTKNNVNLGFWYPTDHIARERKASKEPTVKPWKSKPAEKLSFKPWKSKQVNGASPSCSSSRYRPYKRESKGRNSEKMVTIDDFIKRLKTSRPTDDLNDYSYNLESSKLRMFKRNNLYPLTSKSGTYQEKERPRKWRSSFGNSRSIQRTPRQNKFHNQVSEPESRVHQQERMYSFRHKNIKNNGENPSDKFNFKKIMKTNHKGKTRGATSLTDTSILMRHLRKMSTIAGKLGNLQKQLSVSPLKVDKKSRKRDLKFPRNNYHSSHSKCKPR